jgi:peptidoglycan/LPS O-acetylase OafA/YrhL
LEIVERTNAREMLNALTSFRFIAALMVFIFHVGIGSAYQTGYIGVSFFFILSGFIMTYTYKDKLGSLGSPDVYQIKKYFIARLAKIYPVHFFTFVLAIPYYFFIPLKHETVLYVFQAITNLLLIHSFIPFGNISFNGVSWSLSDELFFYLLFPFILFITIKRINRIVAKLGFICLLFAILLLTFILLPQNNFTTWLAYYFPVVRIFEFFVGIVMGLVFLETKVLLSKFSKWIFSLTEFTSVFLLIVLIFNATNLSQNIRYSLIYIPCLSLVIFVFAFQKGLISVFLTKKTFIYLGEISFSFYMIHNLVLSYIFFLWQPNITSTLTILFCLIISLILSMLLFKFFEEPLRKKIRRYLLTKIVKDGNVLSNKKIG